LQEISYESLFEGGKRCLCVSIIEKRFS
jgi:hypothetical protein